MRAVLDTNVVVSGLLWRGAPRQILEQARAGHFQLFTSDMLLAELEDVLGRSKLAKPLSQNNLTAEQAFDAYAALSMIVVAGEIERISADPDDDHVLACALAAKADVVVSGDGHLLELGQYQGIEIVTAAECLKQLGKD